METTTNNTKAITATTPNLKKILRKTEKLKQ